MLENHRESILAAESPLEDSALIENLKLLQQLNLTFVTNIQLPRAIFF